MAVVGIRWHGEKIKKMASDRMLSRMKDAAAATAEYLKEKVSTPYPPAGPPQGYPAKRTGAHQAGIRWRSNAANRSIQITGGSDHSRYLEFGTRYMAARPTFRFGLRVFKARFKQAMGKHSSGGIR